MEASEISKMKYKFMHIINKKETKVNSALMTNDKYLELIKDVKRAKECQKKVPRDYWLLKHYDVLEIKDTEKLIKPMKETDCEVIYYVMKDDLFDVLYDTHLSIGHGGRDRMVKELNRKYKNVTHEQIKTFLENCETCQQKKNGKKGVVVQQVVFQELNNRCQVDLIDFESYPDDKYKFVMVYEDHRTKFLVLKPLESKCAEDVARCLLEIFLLFGAPSFLQSNTVGDFCIEIIENLKDMWPELKIIHGKTTCSQDQDVENMLSTWMQQNGTNKWSEGLHFVQFMKNRTHHSDIKSTPYKAMFGVDPKVGLSTSPLPKDVLNSLQNEDDLNRVLERMEKETDEPSIEETYKQSRVNDTDNTESLQEIEDSKCMICLQNCSEYNSALIHTHCTDCLKPVHVTCAINGTNEIRQCTQSQSTTNHSKNLHQLAKRRKMTSDENQPTVTIGSTVCVNDVDGERGYPTSVLAIVLDVTDDNFYKLGTRNGIIKQLYERSQFDVCEEKLISVEEVPSAEAPLRTAQSTGTGQSFVKCACIRKCETKKCFCRRKNFLCSSKCHASGSCTNK